MSAMSVPMPLNQRRDSLQAFGLAILIEAAIVVIAGAILISNVQVKPAISEPVPITLTDMPPDEKPPEPEPKPLPPPLLPQPKVKAVVKQAVVAPMPPQVAPQAASVPTEIATTPTAFTQPAAALPPPPPPVNTGKADAQATYAGKVNAAVKAAHESNYPAAATMIRFNGKTQVEFHLQDGILVGEPRVLTSCGNGIFDKSALKAVLIAHYPQPPEELRGDNTAITVWVHFNEH
jgi:TonB family protein